MASGNGGHRNGRAIRAFEPVSEMLDCGTCERLKAAVHGVVLTGVAVCAVYNSAAWLKRRQPHLAINAVIYTAAVLWERSHVLHHLEVCEPARATRDSESPADFAPPAAAHLDAA